MPRAGGASSKRRSPYQPSCPCLLDHPPSRMMTKSHKRRLDVGFALEPLRHGQVLRTQEVGIVKLRLVTRAGVAQERDDRLARPQILRETNCARDIDRRRAAEAKPFVLEQIENVRDRLLVGDE